MRTLQSIYPASYLAENDRRYLSVPQSRIFPWEKPIAECMVIITPTSFLAVRAIAERMQSRHFCAWYAEKSMT